MMFCWDVAEAVGLKVIIQKTKLIDYNIKEEEKAAILYEGRGEGGHTIIEGLRARVV